MTTELFTIPPLEWETCEPSRFSSVESYQVITFCATRYLVARNLSGMWYWQSSVSESEFCPSPEAGKELAEAHWRKYIAQGLESYDPEKILEQRYAEPLEPVVWDAEDRALTSDGTPLADGIRAAAEEIVRKVCRIEPHRCPSYTKAIEEIISLPS